MSQRGNNNITKTHTEVDYFIRDNVLLIMRDTLHTDIYHLNYWVMHPVAHVSINIVYRNLRTQQMYVFVLLCTFYTTGSKHVV
jgi:hypothetical protein